MKTLLAWLAQVLGVEHVQKVDGISPSFAAPWAHGSPAWVFFGCVALAALAILYYTRGQHVAGRRRRITMTVMRAGAMGAVLVMLADPVLTLKLANAPRPLLWVVFDGTESMAIRDELPQSERHRLDAAVGLKPGPPGANKPSRADLVKAWVTKKDGNVLQQLQKKFRLQGFILDRPDGVRGLQWDKPLSDQIDPDRAASLLSTGGQVTALGKAFESLAQRRSTGNLAGVVMVSDFDQNAGPPPIQRAKNLGVPVYTIGVGPVAAVDLGVDLQAPPIMKKGERSSLQVTLRQTGLAGQAVAVNLTAARLEADGSTPAAARTPVGEKTVTLTGPTQTLDFSFIPPDAGRYVFTTDAPILSGETVEQNNHASRQSTARDDFLRLMYVEYEPTWEWRFIKEVFHRDPLVGMRGFRTFLRSADPRVRTGNELFLPGLTPPRSEFFMNDVIFLGDMPAETLSTEFCNRVKEFVERFGGGLVVISGPRFGPAQLASTPLADLLPVVPDASARPDDRPFHLHLTAAADEVDFMHLGDSEQENRKAWADLGTLPWYQPVARVNPLATVLAEHPTDLCADGKTHQPLIAIRRYGKGEVVYLAFDETWRLRRKYGEKYYRQFWGQMIHRLGLSHALGSQKRFVVRTDRPQYRADEAVTITAEVYDANFKPLSENTLTDHKLTGELILPEQAGEPSATQKISLTQLREGVFEARLPVYRAGEHRVRVQDPITGEDAAADFQVTSVSVERRSAVRDVGLQDEVARSTGGRSYDLETATQLPDQITLKPVTEHTIKVVSLGDTWPAFLVVVGLLVGEWFFRKMSNLP